jgi:hypothetical protein
MSARDELIAYCLVATPNDVTFAKAEQLADAYRAEVLREAAVHDADPDSTVPPLCADLTKHAKEAS